MKKVFYLIALTFLAVFTSCEKDIKLMDVNVQLKLAEENAEINLGEVNVTLTSGETIYEALTAPDGTATFTVPSGIYTAAATSSQAANGNYYALNASKDGIAIDEGWITENAIVLELVASRTSQVIIKELYTGGTTNPETEDTEAWDKYMVLYNNSPMQARLNNLGIGFSQGNSNAGFAHGFFDENGENIFAKEDWIPVYHGIYYFPNEVVIEPYSEIVIALNAAIDHTQTNSASIDLSEADYVTYDPECGYDHFKYHPAPSEKIPSSHYLKGVRYGLGNSLAFSMSSPCAMIFQTEGKTPAEWAADETINVYPGRFQGVQAFLSKKMNRSWIIDAVEVMDLNAIDENYKRLTPDLDGGYVYHSINNGYSVYRNVDQAATEAIKENEGKLVYNYALGTADIENGSTDSSKIDAEASIKNGAKIVYKDSNNSTNDFHLRKQCSQKTK